MYRIPIVKCQLVREGSVSTEAPTLQTPEDVARFFAAYLDPEAQDREHFMAAMLNAKNRVVGVTTISIGTLNTSLVHPRELYKPAILAGAAAIILCHNHPSGDPAPSVEDIGLTKRLVEVGKMLGIPVIDHIVLGHDGRFISFAERSLL